jgi:Fe-S-cluster containining protein
MKMKLPKEDSCRNCSVCCQYISVKIDKPDNLEDLDIAIWYLYHGTRIFVDADGWYLQLDAKCQHLGLNGLCKIYKDRPHVCRDYKVFECEKNCKNAYWIIFNTADELKKFVADNPKCKVSNPNEK